MRFAWFASVLFMSGCASNLSDRDEMREMQRDLAAKTARLQEQQLLIEDLEANMAAVARLLRCVEQEENDGHVLLKVVCPPDGI